jgi:hypothetical protein
MTLQLEGFLDPFSGESAEFRFREAPAIAGEFRDELVEGQPTEVEMMLALFPPDLELFSAEARYLGERLPSFARQGDVFPEKGGVGGDRQDDGGEHVADAILAGTETIAQELRSAFQEGDPLLERELLDVRGAEIALDAEAAGDEPVEIVVAIVAAFVRREELGASARTGQLADDDQGAQEGAGAEPQAKFAAGFVFLDDIVEGDHGGLFVLSEFGKRVIPAGAGPEIRSEVSL